MSSPASSSSLASIGGGASLLLTSLTNKDEIDDAIRNNDDKLLVLRFGKDDDPETMRLDEILAKSQRALSKMAVIRTVDVDAVPIYVKYFDICLIPSTIFFFNAQHMKVDYGTQDHTKFIGAFREKQDLIDLVETIFRGAMHGKMMITSPIPASRIPKYSITYQDI